MENVKEGSGGAKCNPSNSAAAEEEDESETQTRTPFTNLSQVDADLALARTLQEQERAYMMLRMNGGEGTSSDYASSEAASYLQEEDDDDDFHDDDDSNNIHLDPSAFTSDEAFARALQDAEDRELAVRMMSLTVPAPNHDWDAEDTQEEDDDTNSQVTWEEVDPDELSYEELLALGEVVGTESRGLSADTIASLPSVNYKAQNSQDGSTEQCVICRLEYVDEDTLTVLSCKHTYHSECINNWLQINKDFGILLGKHVIIASPTNNRFIGTGFVFFAPGQK